MQPFQLTQSGIKPYLKLIFFRQETIFKCSGNLSWGQVGCNVWRLVFEFLIMVGWQGVANVLATAQ